jgi:phosphoglycolate phosphatase
VSDTTVKLVLFDCDGTLVDSQHVILEAMARAFAGAGLAVPPRETVLGIVGLSLTEAMRRIGGEDPAFPAEELAELYRGAFRTLRTEPGFREPLYPGIAEVIETLARRDDLLIGMATGKSQRGARAVLAHHGMTSHFVTVQTADDAPSKPHPEMVLRAMAETGAAPLDTILIGDTSFDMTMARAAGVRAVGVTWGYHARDVLVQSGAERLVDHASALPMVLDGLWMEFA